MSVLKNIAFLIIFLLSFAFAKAQTTPQKTRILFVFDASQSMYGRWDKGQKIQIATRLLREIVDSLKTAENVEVALRVYGHQNNVTSDGRNCKDTKLEVPFSAKNHDKIIDRLGTIRPKGTTLIAYSLEQAAYDFPADKNSRNVIILITDGIEECDGDPCAVSLALQKRGVVLKPFVIGITGGSASGKTLFLKSLLNKFSEEEITLISQDNYYKDRSEMPVDKNGYYNFDLPECIDFQLYSEHIQALIDGKTVIHKEYQFDNSESRKDLPEVMLTHKPSKIIVVEGLFVFYKKKVSKLLDLKIFVDAKEHIKLKRRIDRDKNERGSDLEDVLYRWEKHVAPTFDKYINPTKHKADIIVNNHKHFKNALEIMSVYIESKLKA